MFIFLLQLRHMLGGHPEFYLFAFYSALIWVIWIVKVLMSRLYRPYTAGFSGTTSVVVPVVDEPLGLFRKVLGRMVEQRPSEIIVVINGVPNPGLAGVCEEFSPLVRWVHTPIPGKRNAVMIGTRMSVGEITVLVDSDTVWTQDTLSELVKPFADQRVGGVTTKQRILEPERSWFTRWADWLENTRALYSMPAQTVVGQIGCLPGRTIAFRRSILIRVTEKFMTERFLGVFLEVSDDRTLTNLTLKEGYRTVYQHTSLTYTDAPHEVRKMFKQQLRWARGSQYNTLRMLPWMVGHAPMLAFFFTMDILLPFLLMGVLGGWAYRSLTGNGYNFYEGFLTSYGIQGGVMMVAGLMVASSVVSMSIRQIRHLSEKPSDFFRLPVFIVVSTFFLMPIRLIGFFRMAHAAGWGTRAGAYSGGPSEVSSDEEIAAFDGTVSATARATTMRDATKAAIEATGTVVTEPARRRRNPLAAIPYLIGIAILTAEALFLV
ncbi:glucosaminyltransferase [Leifsonia xyli subsp. cynodontis DSM 46306]|uniref:Glycosyl transferase family 2 n=1 Tax=Leifsonia xyli subsp. cynodontis DSM 46306 TaxID=1389489 RepID=U3P8Q8_LEIXC|nr:glycosyltransferase [Leifsonia xyli]AGW42675.1 glucosaminyltransferase [Leifsonia xyli subsp. cynodontis DSM 46306]